MKKVTIVCLCMVVNCGYLRGEASTNLVGTIAPTPVFVTDSGQYQMMGKMYYEGEEKTASPRSVVVLNFMSLNCGPCKIELPQFLGVVRGAADDAGKRGRKVRYFVVSLDPLSAKNEVRAFMKEQGIALETNALLDPYKKGADKFGVANIPRTIVINERGRITLDIYGAVENYGEQLKTGLTATLQQEQ